MDNDYTPHDAGNNTHQVGDKFYKTEEEMMKHDEVELDLLEERRDDDNITY